MKVNGKKITKREYKLMEDRYNELMSELRQGFPNCTVFKVESKLAEIRGLRSKYGFK